MVGVALGSIALAFDRPHPEDNTLKEKEEQEKKGKDSVTVLEETISYKKRTYSVSPQVASCPNSGHETTEQAEYLINKLWAAMRLRESSSFTGSGR